MAHPNIEDRRDVVQQRIIDRSGMITATDRLIISKKFDCSPSAVYQDCLYLMRNHKFPIAISSKVRKEISARDLFCQYCGKVNGTMIIDHVIPTIMNGPAINYNLVYCCNSCNTFKGKNGSVWIPLNIELLRSLNKSWANKIIKLSPYKEPGNPFTTPLPPDLPKMF